MWHILYFKRYVTNGHSLKIFNHLMDWCRVWYNIQIKYIKFYMDSPYLLQTLHTWIKHKYGEWSQNFTQFIKKMIFAKVWHFNVDRFLFVCETLEYFYIEWKVFYILRFNVGNWATWTKIPSYISCKILGDLERILGWISWVQEVSLS